MAGGKFLLIRLSIFLLFLHLSHSQNLMKQIYLDVFGFSLKQVSTIPMTFQEFRQLPGALDPLQQLYEFIVEETGLEEFQVKDYVNRNVGATKNNRDRKKHHEGMCSCL